MSVPSYFGFVCTEGIDAMCGMFLAGVFLFGLVVYIALPMLFLVAVFHCARKLWRLHQSESMGFRKRVKLAAFIALVIVAVVAICVYYGYHFNTIRTS